MIAIIKSIDLIDYENWSYWPEDVKNFCVAAEVLIGPAEEAGADIFSFEICTPQWFSENKLGAAALVRHVMFVSEYNETVVKTLVADIVAKITGDTWTEVAEKLSRYFRWEFEDYQLLLAPDPLR